MLILPSSKVAEVMEEVAVNAPVPTNLPQVKIRFSDELGPTMANDTHTARYDPVAESVVVKCHRSTERTSTIPQVGLESSSTQEASPS